MKRSRQVLCAVIVCSLLAACSQETTAPVAKPVPDSSAPVSGGQKSPEVEQFPYTAPLTGLGTHTKPQARPVMVMIENHPAARPQSGLAQADIVYEILAEGEITRFAAIFQSNKPEALGPVRSIRPYYIQIGAGYDAVMIHVGGSEEAKEILARSDYSFINEIANGKYFWRENFRKAPHNVYTSPKLIDQAIRDKGMRQGWEPIHFPFLPADAAVSAKESAKTISVTFHPLYQIHYEYDAEKRRYVRYTQGKAHLDLTTNRQLSVTNVLVLAASHRVTDSEGRREVDVVGPGDGYLFQQGKAQKVKWKRSGGVIRAYTDAAMTEEAPLLPGNTWVHIVPNSGGSSGKVTYE